MVYYKKMMWIKISEEKDARDKYQENQGNNNQVSYSSGFILKHLLLPTTLYDYMCWRYCQPEKFT